jgi:UDP-N-acetyl-D-galactosamine dehydrogenase
MRADNCKICIFGLGYVGLPLAVAFGRLREVVAFDISEKRIQELRKGKDITLEVGKDELECVQPNINFTCNSSDIRECNLYIVTVPTPIDKFNRPDLAPLRNSCETIATTLDVGDVVVFESTVYPGVTEEVCVPLLESRSGLEFNRDFYCGYSPERINPGDKEHSLAKIVKVVSGSTPETLELLSDVYGQIIEAGIYKAESIRVAEAAKVIENTQRDLNIALMNELSVIFGKLGIDTLSVLEAASTKWNFLHFKPGLVGGHCIGVDPYYLTHKAQELGYLPQVILSGRRINDSMGGYVAAQLLEMMAQRKIFQPGGRVLFLGLSFKENCPDVRNTRVIDIIKELMHFSLKVDIYDPWVDPDEVLSDYEVPVKSIEQLEKYEAVVIAVAHEHFQTLGIDWIREKLNDGGLIFDLKGMFPLASVDFRL